VTDPAARAAILAEIERQYGAEIAAEPAEREASRKPRG